MDNNNRTYRKHSQYRVGGEAINQQHPVPMPAMTTPSSSPSYPPVMSQPHQSGLMPADNAYNNQQSSYPASNNAPVNAPKQAAPANTRNQPPSSYDNALPQPNPCTQQHTMPAFPLKPHQQNVGRAARNTYKLPLVIVVIIFMIVMIRQSMHDGIQMVPLIASFVFVGLMIAIAFIMAVRFNRADSGAKPIEDPDICEITIDDIKAVYPSVKHIMTNPIIVNAMDDNRIEGNGSIVNSIWYRRPSDGMVHNYRLYTVLPRGGAVMSAITTDLNALTALTLQVAPDGTANIIVDAAQPGAYNVNNAPMDKNIRPIRDHQAVELADTYYTRPTPNAPYQQSPVNNAYNPASEYYRHADEEDGKQQRHGMILPACIIAFTVLWFTVLMPAVSAIASTSVNILLFLFVFTFILFVVCVISVLSLFARWKVYRDWKKNQRK